jgi:hypothetical protein
MQHAQQTTTIADTIAVLRAARLMMNHVCAGAAQENG